MVYAYLSKKIAIPNCENVKCVAWNNEQGWIACGGGGGMLKVLKLENSTSSVANLTKQQGGPSTQLSMNQSLEGHDGTITLATWNKQHEKLTTADSNGLIIVWILYKGIWYEEMINNRNKGIVTGMEWDRNGTRICIIYEDGAVILGSVDGNRIWGKEVKNTNLAHVQWSPDGHFILFGTSGGSLQLFDHQGTFVSKLQDFCHGSSEFKIAAMDWYNGAGGFLHPNVPCLAICYEDGKVQILRNQRDKNPVRFSIDMSGPIIKWNGDGSILAVAGMQLLRGKDGEDKDTCVLQFWSPFGDLLRSIKVPGKTISCISWEKDSLRIAAAVDSFIFFANIRPDYRWSYFANDILVYAFNRPDTSECSLNFWNTKTDEKYSRTVDNLLSITPTKDHVILATKTTDGSLQTVLTLFNAIGVPVESKFIDFDPKFVAVSGSNIICATSSIVVLWQLKLLANVRMTALDAIRKKDAKDRAFHIDDYSSLSSGTVTYLTDELLSRSSSDDPITAMMSSESLLLVARQSGQLIQLLLPSLIVDTTYTLPIIPVSIAINCNSTRISIIDKYGALRLFQLEIKQQLVGRGLVRESSSPAIGSSKTSTDVVSAGVIPDFEKKDICDFKWSNDNPSMFALIEKTRFVLFKDTQSEDSITNSGHICDFNDMEVKVVALNELMQKYDEPSNLFLTNFETKWLRDLKATILDSGLKSAFDFALDKARMRLWKELATASLERLDFEKAEAAFVRCQDYQGLQFIKRLKKLDDPLKKQAEISAYCLDFDGAEKQYMDMDRKDLALDLRIRLGDWFRVVQLIKTGGSGDDALLEKAFNKIGDYYSERQKWQQAVTYYSQARNYERLVDVYYILEDFENIEKIAVNLSENSPHLRSIADKFVAAGLCQPAYNVYMKLGDISGAINACITLNQWGTAISLAETHQFKEIEKYLSQYGSQILAQKREKEAVELFRKANYCQKSAKLMFKMGQEAIKRGRDPTSIKKFFVLAALEVERHFSIQRNASNDVTSALSNLLVAETIAVAEKELFSMEKPWRPAEAYHFYTLAQRQFYSGQLTSAVITSCKLMEYEDILSEMVIYSLIALVSLHAGYYETCSKAFLKLESMEDDNAESYQNLALEIFTRNKPVDPDMGDIIVCSNCLGQIKESDNNCNSCGMQFPTCIASGRPIVESVHFMCHVCKHRALEMEISNYINCPLCHTVL